jgi:hypothetical protein
VSACSCTLVVAAGQWDIGIARGAGYCARLRSVEDAHDEVEAAGQQAGRAVPALLLELRLAHEQRAMRLRRADAAAQHLTVQTGHTRARAGLTGGAELAHRLTEAAAVLTAAVQQAHSLRVHAVEWTEALEAEASRGAAWTAKHRHLPWDTRHADR